MGSRVDRLTPNELVRMGVCQVMEGRRCFQHLTIQENLLSVPSRGVLTALISGASSSSSIPIFRASSCDVWTRRNTPLAASSR